MKTFQIITRDSQPKLIITFETTTIQNALEFIKQGNWRNYIPLEYNKKAYFSLVEIKVVKEFR